MGKTQNDLVCTLALRFVGSYGIQGIGGQMVANLSGDFFTVMGLSMHRTSILLTSALQREAELQNKK